MKSLLIGLGCIIFLTGCGAPEIGLVDGDLRPCPASPNCVISKNGDKDHAIDPITYQTSREEAFAKIRQIVSAYGNTKIMTERKNYLHAEFRTKLMRFVDDVEFLFPEDEKIIHIRSASRVGYSDLGVNRKRVEHIRALFAGKAP